MLMLKKYNKTSSMTRNIGYITLTTYAENKF